MNDTPRLGSAWPSTPTSSDRLPLRVAASDGHVGISPQSAQATLDKGPAIPPKLLAAPSQRLCVCLSYLALTIWRVYDYLTLPPDGIDGFWFFTKWVGVDTAFLYGLCALNIPWIQWSSPAFTVVFISHAIVNWWLMFQIPLPFVPWFLSLSRIIYDREYAISERYIKPASILQNSSLILGKQIIHILPEGAAMLDPDGSSLCVGGSTTTTSLPILINQTRPMFIELSRIDLDSNAQEIIPIHTKELKKLWKSSARDTHASENAGSRLLQYPVKRTGLYRLHKVIDESKLEVRRQLSQAVVVQCPTASIRAQPPDKCKGDLSNIYLRVDATPPLRIRYSKIVNHDDHGHTILSVHPEALARPSLEKDSPYSLARQDLIVDVDASWARTQSTELPLNETLGIAGHWQYTIDEVHDACGNVVNYTHKRLIDSHQQGSLRDTQQVQSFIVHERPKIALRDCNAQVALKVEKGKSRVLGMTIISEDTSPSKDDTYNVAYLFTAQDYILPGVQHSADAVLKHHSIDNQLRAGPHIGEPGLYSLRSLSSAHCDGEIMEPSDCHLINPPEPDVNISTQQIPDKCAGNSIGLTVDLDLVGTPPFQVYYKIEDPENSVTPKTDRIDRFHKQIDLKPMKEGRHSYEFYAISDAVYGEPRSLSHRNLIFSQDVQPPASARIESNGAASSFCLGDSVSITLKLSGDIPYTIHYELVHGDRRTKYVRNEIETKRYDLMTEALNEGGEYALALTSITDATGCKRALEEEIKFTLNLQRPKASFGHIQGTRDILALEGHTISLPIKLQGEPPWDIRYRNNADPSKRTSKLTTSKSNAELEVVDQGTYEIIQVNDASCPGVVETAANIFTVQWIPRPHMDLVKSSSIEIVGGNIVRKAICEGDEDVTELLFTGTAPFSVEYEQRLQNDLGLRSTSIKQINTGIERASLRMETSEPGYYSYRFSRLGDASYVYHPQNALPATLQQRVYARPSASFVETGKTYRYCKEENAGDEVLPIAILGMPPFSLELEIKHYATSKPQPVHIPNIDSNRYELRLPHRMLSLGLHVVTIRKIQDSRGCWRTIDSKDPHVRVSVADLPSITSLEGQQDFCVGDRISFALSGTPPFQVFYTFQDQERKATVPRSEFRRIADSPGDFVLTAIADSRNSDTCRALLHISKIIHELPSVRISHGGLSTVDIHEGGEAEIVFDFGGTPPFYFTYIRSTTPARGKKAVILETKNGFSHKHSLSIKASDAGTYEVISIRDKYCAFSLQQHTQTPQQKLLANS